MYVCMYVHLFTVIDTCKVVIVTNKSLYTILRILDLTFLFLSEIFYLTVAHREIQCRRIACILQGA
jgi:hypothetical protein